MSKYTDDELYQILTETGQLLRGVQPETGEEYSVDAILAEFGQGGAESAPEPEDTPVPREPEPDLPEAEEPEPDPVPREPEEPESAPLPQEPEEEPRRPAPTAHGEDPDLLDTQRLRRAVAANMEKVLGPERRPEIRLSPRHRPKPPAQPEQPPTPAPVEEKAAAPVREEAPAPGQEEQAAEPVREEKPVLQVIHGGADRGSEPEEKKSPEQDSVFPEEPEGMHKVPLEQVMSQTVESVLDEDDAILDAPVPLRDRIADVLTDWQDRLSELMEHRRSRRKEEPSLWEQPENEPETVPEEPEPDMDVAARDEKRVCRKHHRHVLLAAIPALLLAVLTLIDGAGMLREVWTSLPRLRYLLGGGLLAATAALAAPVWEEMAEGLKKGRTGCELSAGFAALVTLADCLAGALTGRAENPPFAVLAAVLIWVCQFALLLQSDARRAAFHLASIGGTPAYGATVTAAGVCKQQGTITGFYNMARRTDPPRRWQSVLVPLFLATATVLAFVVTFSRQEGAGFLWNWSALLAASVPLSLPLTGALPLKYLNQRLVKSGSAVAGYEGARSVSRSRRMVVTDDDLFPPGTVGLNGLKVYGEEIGKVVSYAASMTEVCHSQLLPLFEQLLLAEGGAHLPVEDLHYYEEGGVGGTIHGESVIMGSAYFMRKMHVTLPQELKLKTGVFLAVDGALIAIFAIKYQPSRNVEWALRAMRRNRIEPVLAVRSCNITPGLLKRKFNLDVKPVYPDVSTRLALSDLSREAADKTGAIIYREGLMPFAETAVGSRRMLRSVGTATVLAYLGGLCGLLLGYYLTGVGAAELLDPLRMLVFQGLWLLPTWLLSGLVRHY